MKETGEVEYAKEEIEWAEVEDQPREIFPCDVGRLLEDRNPSIFSSRPLEHLDVFSRTESDEKVAFLFPFGSSLISQYRFFLKRGTRRTKPIHSNNEYRFTFYHRSSSSTMKATLFEFQKVIPPSAYHHQRKSMCTDCISRLMRKNVPSDSVRLSRKGTLPPILRVAACSSSLLLFNPPTPPPSSYMGPDSKAIFAKFPKKPEPPLSTPEAHLYLSSKRIIGRGHHSAVHSAEWEIPRTWLPSFRPRVCERCASLALLEKLKKDMPDVEVDETEYAGKQISTFLNELARRSAATGFLHEDTSKTKMTCGGPVRQIDIDVQWQGPGTYCKHETCRSNKTTFRTLVSAKLSIKHDVHLKQEAKNYQKFPAHFFQHWNGYNIVPPLHDPTPIGAVVPQFYGYYVRRRVTAIRDT